MEHTGQLNTGGPLTITLGDAELELEVSLTWTWQEAEPGSLSIGGGWFLDEIRAWDDEGRDWDLTTDQEDEAIHLYPPTT